MSFTEAFPDLEFTRGDSWENTIAFGKDHCEYILEVKRASLSQMYPSSDLDQDFGGMDEKNCPV